jgi:nucleotide-binding universal stress UspA family protein
MSEAAGKRRRILLPVDVSRDSLTALEIAFDLAAALGGEISGLFIEDARLVAAGSLPFAREVGSMSGIRRSIGIADIEERFRAVADAARTALDEAGRRLKVPSSFRVARGDVPGEILSAAVDADLVVLGKAGWSAGTFRKPGSTCLTILSRSRVPVLIVEKGVRLSPPIMVVHDGAAGERALAFARALSSELGWDVAAFPVEEALQSGGVFERARQEKPRLIVLPSSLSERLPSWTCPVLFVP